MNHKKELLKSLWVEGLGLPLRLLAAFKRWGLE